MKRKNATVIVSILLGLTLLGAGCGSNDPENPTTVGGGGGGPSSGVPTVPGYQNSNCFAYGVIWYDYYTGQPIFCQLNYNFWVYGNNLQATQYTISPYDIVGIVGYIPANYGYLHIFNSASSYYQWSLFYGGSWNSNWSNSWNYWYSYGFSSGWDYQSHFSSNPYITNQWQSTSTVYIYVNGTMVNTFNGTNYLWTNNTYTGPLSIHHVGGNPGDAYLLSVQHCENMSGQTIVCPWQ